MGPAVVTTSSAPSSRATVSFRCPPAAATTLAPARCPSWTSKLPTPPARPRPGPFDPPAWLRCAPAVLLFGHRPAGLAPQAHPPLPSSEVITRRSTSAGCYHSDAWSPSKPGVGLALRRLANFLARLGRSCSLSTYPTQMMAASWARTILLRLTALRLASNCWPVLNREAQSPWSAPGRGRGTTVRRVPRQDDKPPL